MKEIANFFWHGTLPNLQKSAINSFIQNGFDVRIWSYTPYTLNGVKTLDANLILPQSDIGKYTQLDPAGKTDTLALFSDLFRFKILAKEEGWWFDTDCFCLKPVKAFKDLKVKIGKRDFLCGYHKIGESDQITGSSVLYSNSSTAQKIVEIIEELLIKHSNNFSEWGLLGPTLVNNFTSTTNRIDRRLPVEYFYELHWNEVAEFNSAKKVTSAMRRVKNSYVTHVWNSSAERLENENVEIGSFLYNLIDKYKC